MALFRFSTLLIRRSAFGPGILASLEMKVKEDTRERTKNRRPRGNSRVAGILFNLVVLVKRDLNGRQDQKLKKSPEETRAYVESE